jgi:hypothetical protein
MQPRSSRIQPKLIPSRQYRISPFFSADPVKLGQEEHRQASFMLSYRFHRSSFFSGRSSRVLCSKVSMEMTHERR